jgi:hypothetical protein
MRKSFDSPQALAREHLEFDAFAGHDCLKRRATCWDPRGNLLLVDARDPTNLVLYSMAQVAKLAGIAVNGNTLYAATDDGMSVFLYAVRDLAELHIQRHGSIRDQATA